MSRMIRFCLREEVEIQEMLTLVAPNKKKRRKRRGGRRFLELTLDSGKGGGEETIPRSGPPRFGIQNMEREGKRPEGGGE